MIKEIEYKYYISKGPTIEKIYLKDEIVFRIGSALAGIKVREISKKYYDKIKIEIKGVK